MEIQKERRVMILKVYPAMAMSGIPCGWDTAAQRRV